ncbi:MAG: alpha/beta fold hydrolase [Acidimicrobiales bacterium]
MTNLLLITADQHNPFVIGSAGDPLARTPNLDSLAVDGVSFEAAYTNNPICMPARASLATGRYGSLIGTVDNGSPYHQRLAPSFGHRLRAAGVAAVTFGKLHFDADSDSGFDMRLPLQAKSGYHGARVGWARQHAPADAAMANHARDAAAGPSEYERYDRHTTMATCRWLLNDAPPEPWMAHVSFAYPHYPFRAPAHLMPNDRTEVPMPPAWRVEEWPHNAEFDVHRRLMRLNERPLTEDELRQLRWVYSGMVQFVDEQVGRVLQALDAAGFADDTVVIYTSDHGDMLGSHGFLMKSVMYDGSARVPLLMRGPGIDPGATCQTAVSLVDIFPTVLDVVGVAAAEQDHDLPGSTLRHLAGSSHDQERAVFSEYHGPTSAAASYMIRRGRWKYVKHLFDGSGSQLFDLHADPHELDDLAAVPGPDPGHRDVIATLDATLRSILDPEATDAAVRARQTAELDGFGPLVGRDPDAAEPRTPLGSIATGWSIPSDEIMSVVEPAAQLPPVVLIHGGWMGGWAWDALTPHLVAAGHDVHTPTLVGLGDRQAEGGPATTIIDQVDDLALWLKRFERPVTLLGHSYSGMVATMLADRLPEMVARLVILDGFVPLDGEGIADLVDPSEAKETAKAVAAHGQRPPPDPARWGVSDPATTNMLRARLTPHPGGTTAERVRLSGRYAGPKDYISMTQDQKQHFVRTADRLRDDNSWALHEYDGGHLDMIIAPEHLAQTLVAVLAKKV